MKIQLTSTLPLLLLHSTHAFTQVPVRRTASYNSGVRSITTFLRSTSTSTTTLLIDEINAMRAGAIKKELESMGINTKTFLEKSELVDALVKAREEGRTGTPVVETKEAKEEEVEQDEDATTSTSSSTSSSLSRAEKIAEEMQKCQSMKAGELKKELESLGISTKTFFEKSEFVKALAEARVDGVTTNKKAPQNDDGESYAEYSNVEVLTSDSAGPRPKQKQQQQQQQQRGAGSPFGGGGMGGMNLEDLMKNMGGMGGNPFGGGANPFAGAAGGANPFASGAANPFGGAAGGANPFGGAGGGMPDMKKAQEMMSNPKVRELMVKAQGNPKVMRVMQECMSNPAAFMKYQNDPEVAELIAELKKLM
mmetsp:Transcript_15561/g.24193  ORF Transcript_15561/g.24193 Transcript_15561/m.24193 type:complete len:365 (-) Transcript_15561:13-1107(-)